MKYHIVTLGCQMNKSDSERVHAVLNNLGYIETSSEEDANLIGVIACSVRQKAIDRVYSKISKWNKWKNNKNLVTFLSGCILPADKVKFLKKFDIIFQMSELNEFEKMLDQYGVLTKTQTLPKALTTNSEVNNQLGDFWDIKADYSSTFEAFVPIQNGCNKFCTYCAVPYTRGREISRSSNDIINEVKDLVNKNYKSITLLGQNVNSYGLDKNGKELNFAELLQKIGEFSKEENKDFWLYFTSPHPQDMTDDVIQVMSKYKCLAKQVHLPLQSGDDNILKAMNRNHDMARYRQIVTSIRKTLPSATLFTDIIVGFIGESDEAFENTRKALKEFNYNMAYIAQYSPRPGAASFKKNDDIPHQTKKQRFHLLSDDLTKISYQNNLQMKNKTYKVLVNGKSKKGDFFHGTTEGRIIVRFPNNGENLIGQFIHLKITKISDFSVEGEILNEQK